MLPYPSKSNLDIMRLNLTLEFFAAVMQAPKKDVSYALLAQTEEGITEYRPIVTVKNLKNYAYDIRSAQFISIEAVPEVTKTIEPANVIKSRRGVIFKSAKSNAEEVYTTLDFYHTYKTVVLNDLLS